MSPARLAEAWQLFEHGEPALGLCMLAWVIAEDGVAVDRAVVEGIRRLSAGLVEPGELPPDLDAWAR